MHIFYLCVQLIMPYAKSLKEKRMVVQSVKKRIKNKFNVSITEIAKQDQWHVAEIGMVGIVMSRAQGDDTMENLINWLDANCEGDVLVKEKSYL